MITAEQLPLAPRWLGELMYPGGAPIQKENHSYEGASVDKLFSQQCAKGNLTEDQIQFLKQYLIYYVNAPIFDSEFTDELRGKLSMDMDIFAMMDLCLDYGLDPL